SRPERSIAIPCGLCMADSRRDLARRFHRIMDVTAKHSKGLSWRGVLVIVLLGLLLLPGLRESVADEKPAAKSVAAGKADKPTAGEIKEKESEVSKNVKGEQGVCTFTGMVENEAGKPVEGADVWICRSERTIYPTIKVVAHAKTDSSGEYRIEVPIKKLAELNYSNWLHSMVYKSGYCPAFEGVSSHFNRWQMNWISRGYSTDFSSQLAGEVFANEQPLKLCPTTKVSIKIVGPDKKPVANAKVIHSPAVGWGIECWDDDLRKHFEKDLSSTTDADGMVTLRVAPRDESLGITVKSHRYGQQNFRWRNQSPPLTINLQPTGSLVGRLVADDAKVVAGRKLRFSARVSKRDPYGQETPNGSDVVITDDKGRFRVPAIIEGRLSIHANDFEPLGSPYHAIIPDDIYIAAGQTTDIEIPLKKATEVTGKVVDQSSGKPMAGMKIDVQQEVFNRQGIYNHKTITTDAKGQYRIFLLPGEATFESRLKQYYTSPGIHRSMGFTKRLTIPEGRSTYELPLFKIIRGVTLRGKVFEESGIPIANVLINATSQMQNGSDANAPYTLPHAVSDENGNFTLEEIDSSLTLSVAAKTSTLVSVPQKVEADSGKLIEIIIPKEKFVSLSGRVVDGNGKPVAGVKYNILASKPFNLNSSTAYQGVTDQKGKLKTPNIFLMGRGYLLEVLVNDIVVANSKGIAPKVNGRHTFGDVVLRWPLPDGQKPRIVVYKRLVGQVVDRHGQPVPEAKIVVWHSGYRLQTRGDRDGRFHAPNLEHVQGVPVNGAFVTVEAEDFRFHGDLIRPGDEPVTVVLTRTNEIPNMRAQGVDTKETPEKVLAAVRKWEKSDVARGGLDKDATSPAPKDTRTELMKKYREKLQACCKTVAADLARARRMAESIDDVSLRAYALGLMAGELAVSDRSGARKLLDESYAMLDQIAEREASGSPNSWSPVTIGAALLPAVEKIDPELVPEYLWRALSCRTNIKVGGGPRDTLGRRNGRLELADPLLAILLADYDGDLARRIFVPPDDQSVVTRGGRFPRYFFAATAVLDPQAGLKSLDAIPQSTEEMKVQKRQAWRDFITLLNSDRQVRRTWVLEKLRLCDCAEPDSNR
ncbi:MAG: hypothetical protein JXM70_20730, partial [Pirellulales bacterium]|nr:hypothetical protein [Pirellulales bacterium]